MSANGDGAQQAGEIHREGDRFVVYVASRRIAATSSIGNAAHRLAEALRRDLPPNPRGWGVEVDCRTSPGVGLRFGNRAGGGGVGSPADPCVARALRTYARDANNLQRALEAAARLLAECCR